MNHTHLPPAESAPVPPRSVTAGWRPDIQGLRALAVLLVVAYHADLPVPGGFVGVDIFFVISGFVITLLLLREWTKEPHYRLRRFWGARVRRILPVLAVVVLTVLLLSALFEDPSGAQQQTVRTAVASLLMVSNIYLERSGNNYFLEPSYVNPLLNTWSLGVEEQFYVLFPLLFVILVYRSRGKLQAFVFGLSVLTVLSFALNLALTYSVRSFPLIPSPETFAFFSVTTRAWQFSLGALLAVVAFKKVRITHTVRQILGLSGSVLIVIGAFAITSSTPYPGIASLVPTLGTVGLVAAGIGGNWSGTSLLSSRFSTFIGDRSYSIYLWHWPLLVFAGLIDTDSITGVVLALVLTLLLSMATYRWVENPFRFARGRQRATFLALGLVVVGLAAGAAVGQAVKFGWGQSWTLGAHQAMQRDCDNPPIDPVRCRWGPEGQGPEVLVVGDSQAWASGDAVIQATARLGGSTVITAYNNCPFTAGVLPADGGCAEWQMDVLNYIDSRKPDAVVVATATYSGGISSSVANKTMVEISRRGSRPIFLMNPPGAPSGARNSLLLAPASNRSEPLGPAQFTIEEIANLRDEWGDGAIINPFDRLCDELQCFVAKDGVEYYTDGNHLSVDGAALLTPLFQTAIEQTAFVSGS